MAKEHQHPEWGKNKNNDKDKEVFYMADNATKLVVGTMHLIKKILIFFIGLLIIIFGIL